MTIIQTNEIETLASRVNSFTTPFLEVSLDEVKFPNGNVGEYSVISQGNGYGCVIIPITRLRGVVYIGLARQYRYPLRSETLEFPRGGTDDLSPTEANREMLEEFGFKSPSLSSLGTIYPDTGILSTEVAVYLGRVAPEILVEGFIEEDTGLSTVWVSEGEFQGMIVSGKIKCGMTLAAYAQFVINRGSLEEY